MLPDFNYILLLDCNKGAEENLLRVPAGWAFRRNGDIEGTGVAVEVVYRAKGGVWGWGLPSTSRGVLERWGIYDIAKRCVLIAWRSVGDAETEQTRE